ncbi:MAG TPA: homogentisate 1,2-dioxygenase [Candidatus Saccharimonadales bacterium]|nr:homogentisate 1,2-dioxygenase [Candidatus Saccharimonadales bacterium]
MPMYHALGLIPHKRHTQFRKPDGALFSEQLMGSKGFSGISSLLYHHHPPTQAGRVGPAVPAAVPLAPREPLRHHHLRTQGLKPAGDAISGRRVLLANEDVSLALCLPAGAMRYHYRNGQGDELHFVHQGTGRFETVFGTLHYRPGDYVVIPRGTTWKLVADRGPQRFLVVESASQIEPPRRYRNEYGQLLEHAPYCERDIRLPARLETHTARGRFEVRVKARDELTSYWFAFHPLDVVGWDGYLYPWIFNIEDFEPITGRIHQPPPVHQTFEGRGFVVCSFCPRKYDYHPLAVPVPYNHSNVDSDEVIYYVNGSFMSRRGIESGSFTVHPQGIPHGPHPGAVEASLGRESTDELAVMLDTFRPLHLTAEALQLDDPGYPLSWVPPARAGRARGARAGRPARSRAPKAARGRARRK